MGIDIKKMEEKLIEKYKKKIKLLNETIWERKVPEKKIDDWLSNFKKSEQHQALYLLTQFIFFNQFQIKTLLISLFRDLYKYREIEKIRKKNSDTLDFNLINNEFTSVLNKTRFVPLGGTSESSTFLMYPFRQLNKLSEYDHFFSESDIITKVEEVEHFIFIDDLCGSGSQAIDYAFKTIPLIKENFPNAEISYFMLVGSKEGKDNVLQNSDFDNVESVVEFDASYKCFSENSRVFENKDPEIDIDLIEKFCGTYGKPLIKSILTSLYPGEDIDNDADLNKLGFSNGQLLLAFDHNTPDNTLPIFWYDEDIVPWNPIFERANKL